jgi:hypothetical protein
VHRRRAGGSRAEVRRREQGAGGIIGARLTGGGPYGCPARRIDVPNLEQGWVEPEQFVQMGHSAGTMF